MSNKETLDYLVEEQTKDIEKRLKKVQLATRSSFVQLEKPHNFMVTKFSWYKAWHENPWVLRIHAIALAFYSVFMISFLLLNVFGNPFTSKAAGNTYYVSKTSCSDSYPGTQAQPFCTIQHAADTVTAGDTVYVREGTYNESITISVSGTSESLITIKNYPNETPVIDGQNVRSNGIVFHQNYVTIDGFTVTRTSGTAILANWNSGSGYGLTIKNCTIYETAAGQINTAGIYYRYSRGGLIENNTIYNTGGDGITIPTVTDGITIRNNVVHDNDVDGIKGGGSGSIIIEGNTLYNHISGTNHGDGIQYMGDEVILRNNVLYNNTQNIFINPYTATPGDHLLKTYQVYNNLIYVNNGTYKNGIVVDGRHNTFDKIYILNNTIVDQNEGSGGVRMFGSYGANTLVVKNNIFQNSYLIKDADFPVGSLDINYNLYWTDRTWNTNAISYNGITYMTPATFNTATGLESQGIYGDALLKNLGFFDFHLLFTSPARSAGIGPSADVNVPTTDKEGISRSGATTDIGAYMYTNTYYVSKTGNDTAGDGSSGNPWLTIQHAADTVVAGDTVNVSAGTYNERVSISKVGTVDSPILFQGNGADRPVVSQGFYLHGSYTTIKQFEIIGGFQGSTEGGALVRAAINLLGSHNIVDDVNLYHLTQTFGQEGVFMGNDAYGTLKNSNWVDYCTWDASCVGVLAFDHNTVSNMVFNAVTGDNVLSMRSNVLVENSEFLGPVEGIKVTFDGKNSILRNSKLYMLGRPQGSSAHTETIGFRRASYSPSDGVIEGNTVDGCVFASPPEFTEWDPVRQPGVIWEAAPFHIFFFGGIGNIVTYRNNHVQNSVFLPDVSRFTDMNGTNTVMETQYFYNNVFHGIAGPQLDNSNVWRNNIINADFIVRNTTGGDPQDSDYNLYDSTYHTSLPAVEGSHSFLGNPRLKWKEDGFSIGSSNRYGLDLDWSIVSTSDAIGTGIGPSIDASVPTTDKDGNARSGTATDIGAYEYQGSGPDTTPPTFTSNPTDGTTSFSISSNIVLTSNESLSSGTVNTTNVKLKKYSDSSTITSTITYNDTNKTITINPSSNLSYNTQYYIYLANVTDTSGNPVVSWSDALKSSHEFTTLADSTNPTVSLISPTALQVLSGSVAMSATASDNNAVASVQFLVDGNVVNTDTTSPYSYSWSSASVADGTHTVSAKAIDVSNNSTTTTPITVSTLNGTPPVSSGYVLDGWGGVHAFGGASQVTQKSTYWKHWDIARDFDVRSDGHSGYVLDGFGGINPFGGAPSITNPSPYWSWDIARRIVLVTDTSGYVLDGWGGVHPFGGAPAITQKSTYWKHWDIARDFDVRSDGHSGYVLDGFGGINPFGGAPSITNPSPYWSWDIARRIVLVTDTSGYVLDGWGGVHPFGGAPTITQKSTYWKHWDIARDFDVRSDGHSGYVLDGFGGINPFGGAPSITNPSPYWSWDIARRIVLR